jgi:hypothetical protein
MIGKFIVVHWVSLMSLTQLELRDQAQLGGADRGVVGRMGEENAPAASQPLMEINGAFGGHRGEIGGFVAKSECHDVGRFCGLLQFRAGTVATT